MSKKRDPSRDLVLQFKVSLRDISPPVWRRLQVPASYSFWDLHVAIQDAMGWLDCHLHEFQIRNPSTGESDLIGIVDDDAPPAMKAGWDIPVVRHFTLENRKARYCYDFGDDWEHDVELEWILPRELSQDYPLCIAGRRACPPEDCGGPAGYERFLVAISRPSHEDHEVMVQWIGRPFDAERFDETAVRFDDPQERWNTAFLTSGS